MATLSLNGTVHKLHDLIFKIAIPKSKTTKTTSITIDMLLLACELAKSTCVQLQGHHGIPQADDISRQLEDIRAHLGISSTAQSPQTPQKPTYTPTLTVGAKSAVPATDLPPPQPQPPSLSINLTSVRATLR